MDEWEQVLSDAAATTDLAMQAAKAVGDDGLVIYLQGDLGAGKSHFVRGLLRALGVAGPIKSPTYSLIEDYSLDGRTAWHLDLYRIADPGELEWLGLDALADPRALVLVEWPEHGAGMLPPADIRLRLSHLGAGRRISMQPSSPRGRAFLSRI